jgi:hypothetical protein
MVRMWIIMVLAAVGASSLGAAGTAGQKPAASVERRLSGIELSRTFPHELIPRWGPPTRIKDTTFGSTGSLTYTWERVGARIDVTVVYWTREDQRCESAIEKVLVSGIRPTPDGIGRTGCGVALGDGIDDVRACYGNPHQDYVIRKKGTTPDALPAGTRIVAYAWGFDSYLELALDAGSRKVTRMELRVAEH